MASNWAAAASACGCWSPLSVVEPGLVFQSYWRKKENLYIYVIYICVLYIYVIYICYIYICYIYIYVIYMLYICYIYMLYIYVMYIYMLYIYIGDFILVELRTVCPEKWKNGKHPLGPMDKPMPSSFLGTLPPCLTPWVGQGGSPNCAQMAAFSASKFES